MRLYQKVAYAAVFAFGVASGASALTINPNAPCALTDVQGSTQCIGMVTDTGMNPSTNDSAAVFNANSFFSLTGWSQSDKAGVGSATGTNGILSVTYYAGNQTGTYSFSPLVNTAYALVLKASSGFSAYLLGPNVGGNWGTFTLQTKSGQQPAISHISLYQTNVATVPLPLPVLMLGTALVGLAGFGVRKRTQA